MTGFRQVDCCFGALAKMAPDRVFAASDGGNLGVSIGGYDSNRKPFIYVDFFAGGWGGRPWGDGPQGNANLGANISSPSVEITEVEQPLQILTYEFLTDGMGAGKYRGGAPFRRDYRMREAEGTLQVRNDRCIFRPFGLYGGSPGQVGRNVLNPNTDNEPLRGKITRAIKRGDVFRYDMAGAGGWGDPLDRDPSRVLSDVRNEYVSVTAAREQYGVVLREGSWEVDEQKTTELRREIRQRRGWKEPPLINRGELPPGVYAPDEKVRGTNVTRGKA
jgi:N-methylhydantoinase B